MITKQKIIQKISADELDEVLQLAADEKWTDLAILGSEKTVDRDEKHWPDFLKRHTHIYYSSSFVSSLVEKLSNLSNLTSLSLWNHSLGISEAEHISKLSNLTALNLSGNLIGASGAEYISRLSNLIRLDLGGNRIGVNGAEHISRLSNLTTLELGGNQVGASGAEYISRLSNLTTLGLGGNQIGASGVEYISKLSNLLTLNLVGDQIGDSGAKYISKLSNLRKFNLGGSQLGASGAEYISRLSNLIMLNLNGNRIGESGAKYISKLINLRKLDLSGNQVGASGAEYISKLINLTMLNLANNQVGDSGAEYISKLTNLTTLDLANNQIGDSGVRYMPKLNNLTILNLAHNQLGDSGAEHISKLSKLTVLNLSFTTIKDLATLSNLPFLRMLNISNTAVTNLFPLKYLLGKDIIARWESSNLKNGISVKDCPLIHPPPEIVKQGHDAVLNYFREIDAQGTATLLEAKVLIVGEGRAGKTSLLRRLYQRDKPLPTEDETTRGIDICPYDFRLGDGQTFRLNVWDFGGQQIYHATHQFFLTKNSLYILLDDTAKDYKSVTDEGFRYWFEVIDLLSKHSPVLIFQNEKGGRSKQIDIAGIKGLFDNVKELYSGNLEIPGSADKLAREIEHQVQQLPHVGEQVPAKWVDIRKALEQIAANTPYITQQDYFDLYARHLEFDHTKALRLSQYLHDLGVFLHFQDDDVLCKSMILQNRWATEAVFRVIDDETVKSRLGRFTITDCERIWKDSEYRDMHSELRALMEKFELCYALPDLPKSDKTWLMPQLLPPSMPTALLDWAKPGDLVLTYRYHFLPKGLVSRLMVRKHRYVVCPDLAWTNGVLFEADGSSVLVQATSRGNEIVLRARGVDAKALLSIIAADLDALHASFSGLEEKLQKLIPCNCEQCVISAAPEMYEYKYLLKRKQDGRFNIECRASYQEVNVLSLLDGFIPAPILDEMQNRKEVKTASQPETKTVKIFLASSNELKDDREKFKGYFFEQNKRWRKKGIILDIISWENFLDAMSKTRLQDEYNKEVRDCDIFVSLFMTKTGSFTEEEFDVAYQAFQKNGKPHIYTYFKDAPTSIGSIDESALQTLLNFRKKIEAMGHFWTLYSDIEHLKRQFSDQLDKLLDGA